MAVSGIVLFGFVLVHMLGNLKLYLGPEALNAYAEWLREMGHPVLPRGVGLWIARLVLIAAVAVHVTTATQLTLQNLRARPAGYAYRKVVQATYAARTMRWSGVIILLFVVYHLLHLTSGTLHPQFDAGDVYHNVVAGFRVWWVAAVYVAANLLLGLHLFHGLWSMFQTLGCTHPKYNHWRLWFARVFAAVITLGNVSFPLAVLLGFVS
ncbi:MAG: succinate dehydrogenase [Acidobacteria bacterium]|nr:MAG: succinate dehydrogenase [Acidobacteriota bacterium]